MNSTLNIYGRSALLAITLISGDLFAGDAMFVYRGEAKNQGKIVYIERHRVFLDQAGKIERAETEYERSDGSKIASLSSDFRSSLTSPDHTIIDLRTGEVQGVRRESEKIVLFYKEKDKPEETKTLTGEEIHERVLVGCQGLHYYVVANLHNEVLKKKIPLRFLIPGKLDFYDFDMTPHEAEDGGTANFKIEINNWFLRIFAPHLLVKYDRLSKRIVWYQGLSNLRTDEGDNQNVTIDYFYP